MCFFLAGNRSVDVATKPTHAPPRPSLGIWVCGATFLFLMVSVFTVLTNSLGMNLLGYPRLSLNPEKIELGEVEANTTVSVAVAVRNVGAGKLELNAVKGSCDACIRVKSWPTDGIPEAETREVLLEIDTGNAHGIIQKQVVFLSNDWSGKPYVLKCSWNAITKKNE